MEFWAALLRFPLKFPAIYYVSVQHVGSVFHYRLAPDDNYDYVVADVLVFGAVSAMVVIVWLYAVPIKF